MGLNSLLNQETIGALSIINKQDPQGEFCLSDDDLQSAKKEILGVLGISDQFTPDKLGILSEGDSAIRQVEEGEQINFALKIPFAGSAKLNPREHVGEISMALSVDTENKAKIEFTAAGSKIISMQLNRARQIFEALKWHVKTGSSLWVLGPIVSTETESIDTDFSILSVSQNSSGVFEYSVTAPDNQVQKIPVQAVQTTYSTETGDYDNVVIKFMIPEWGDEKTPHIIENMWGPGVNPPCKGVAIWSVNKVKDGLKTFTEIPNFVSVANLKNRRRMYLHVPLDFTFKADQK